MQDFHIDMNVLYPLESHNNLVTVAIGRRNANQAIEIGKKMYFTNSRNKSYVCGLEDYTGVSEEIDTEGQRTSTTDEIREF